MPVGAPSRGGPDCVVPCSQTVAPNVTKAGGRTDPNAAVLGSLAALVEAPDWGGAPRRRPARMPAGEVLLEIDVPSFTDQALLRSTLLCRSCNSSQFCPRVPPRDDGACSYLH